MLNFLKNILSPKRSLTTEENSFKIQSFTYYVPSPPSRDTGYREKQFDKIFYDFINLGYEILEFRVAPNNGQASSGIWIIFILRALNQKASELNLDEVINDKINKDQSAIEGLYYLDDGSQL